MKNAIITIHDCITGETVVREMTDEENAEYEAIIANSPALPDLE
jgi:hypothetical protein